MKILRVTMPDGSKWDVPADLIARSRALHYAGGDEKSVEFQREFDYTMGDNGELKDWAANNMNWIDICAHAKRAVQPLAQPDFQEGWVNGEKEIVEALI